MLPTALLALGAADNDMLRDFMANTIFGAVRGAAARLSELAPDICFNALHGVGGQSMDGLSAYYRDVYF